MKIKGNRPWSASWRVNPEKKLNISMRITDMALNSGASATKNALLNSCGAVLRSDYLLVHILLFAFFSGKFAVWFKRKLIFLTFY